ncbi:hypothetical protein M3Y94_00004900 [Aphelenchoides besseyi]|nr:hypothetical protein M3Y94_00004900 [Aphelenchoides besseyi]KAI6220766.1 hypothetical protein M3Y95_01030800 [Aphelenchoides besseyi]
MNLRSKTVRPTLVYVDGEFRSNVCVQIDGNGKIERVEAAENFSSETVELKDSALFPGFINAHSHAFHRQLRGQSGIGGAGEENFWVWRDQMYKLVQEADHSKIQKYCEDTFAEMLQSGITTVGEFHYVHHNVDRFDLDSAVIAAAQKVGIRLVLIVTLYCRSGFDATEVQPQQKRFESQIDEFVEHVRKLKANLPQGVTLAIAAHSLRAVPKDQLERLYEFATVESLQLHLHLEEQPKEIQDCESVESCQPSELLLSTLPKADQRLTAVHCTYTKRENLNEFAKRGINVCICPLTEGFLGDGIPGLTHDDLLCLGTDCNNRLCFLEEMRWLAYCQNMKTNTRNACGFDAHKLLQIATKNAAKSLGINNVVGELKSGLEADFFVVDLNSPKLKEIQANQLADALMDEFDYEELLISGTYAQRLHNESLDSQPTPSFNTDNNDSEHFEPNTSESRLQYSFELDTSDSSQVRSFRDDSNDPRFRRTYLNRGGSGRNTSGSSDWNTVVALIEGRGNESGTIGMAAVDLRFLEFRLYQFVDTQSYTLLKSTVRLLDPIEIAMPDHMNDRQGSGRFFNESIAKIFDDIEIQLLPKRAFNETAGIDTMKKLAASESSNLDSTTYKKRFAMSAAYALIKYVESSQQIVLAGNALRIRFESVEDSCLIDIASWENLELFYKKPKTKSSAYRCLFDRLNTCLTNGGTQTLRSCLLQPSANVIEINERLDVVEELVKSPAMLDKIRSWLSSVQDLQHLIKICVYTDMNSLNAADSRRAVRQRLTQLLCLRTMLKNTTTLKATLRNSTTHFIQKNLMKICDSRLMLIASCIDRKINEKAAVQKQQRGSMAANDTLLNAVIDNNIKLALARRAHVELVGQVNELVKKEGFVDLGAVLSWTYGRGYHYSIKNELVKRLKSSVCIQMVRNRQHTTFTTLYLMRYNDRLNQVASEIFIQSNFVISDLLVEIRQYISALHNCVEFIAQLDCFCALANYSSKLNQAARPRFEDQMAIRDGKHPLLDDANDKVIPNDTFVSMETRFCLITGPNMAGKSTYIKQICLLQVLAQTGCFVPATYACFVPRRHIFSRVGHNDDLGDNLSSFGVEMSEIASMLQSATEHSLIIIDELARSTATEEGIGICFAISEKLVETKAFVFLATHYLDLCLMEAHFTVLRNFHFSAATGVYEDGTEFLIPTHQLLAGPYKGPLYGLELAELTSLPKEVVDSSKVLAQQLHSAVHAQRNQETTKSRIRRFCQLAHCLCDLLDRQTTDEQLATYMINLRTKFVEMFS